MLLPLGEIKMNIYMSVWPLIGSPYTMEIIDAADVEASGDALETAEVNRRAMFNVDIGRNGSSRDLKVQIRCMPFTSQ